MSGMSTEIVGYCAAVLVFCSFYMKTMKSLRIIAIFGNIFILIYASLTGSIPIIVLQLTILPLNLIRLRQFQKVLNDMKAASEDTYDLSPLIPYMTLEHYRGDEFIFREGDRAGKFYIVQSGLVHIEGVNAIVRPGEVLGEIGIFTRERVRTAAAKAEGDTSLYAITDDTIRQLHFQSPDFGLYLVRLIIARLQNNRVQSRSS